MEAAQIERTISEEAIPGDLGEGLAAAGELLSAIADGTVTQAHIAGEIGEVVMGAVTGRASDDEITIYKSLDVSAQDLAAGHAVWAAAEAEGAGQMVDLLA